MGRGYRQLSLDECIEVARLKEAGWSLRRIGAAIGRSHTTVSREVSRNSRATKLWSDGYAPVRAQELAVRRRRWDCRFKLVRQPDLQDRVRQSLAMGHSPEQIAGRLAREAGRTVISHESIYRFVYHRSAQKDYWHRLLPRAKSRRGRYRMHGGSPASFIKHRRPITERTPEADTRRQPGHWEADYMLFAAYGQGVLVLHERATRFTLLDHPPHRKAAMTAQRLARRLCGLPQDLRRTISFDNGTEFAQHHRLHHLGLQTFFCDVRSPWQKGGVENTIGRLRRLLPRKTNLDTLSPEQLRAYPQRLNDTPRKCLDFQTPAEAFLRISTGALQT
ncbi:Integrase, catalytic region [Sphingomonas sp. EC-HK361]|uniref:IS30 family transposase n=1 Tax=Sphingomonas sp. EC-HK361 TaxID=2038397 RepID=UPI00125887C8|nr:IS30 family transposase [Sphingomonas sp. EC-HK361]VVT02458.1 Integrase, catalytic region [Sphingomonas sp. EC-HK361]